MFLISGGIHSLLLIITTSATIFVGLTVFVQGFLLTRNAILINSSCQDYGQQHQSDDCWIPRSFNRSVILLIDGLRFDFTDYDESLKPENVPYYLNNMPIFKEILQKEKFCNNCSELNSTWSGSGFLARFIADAPTTTMQRLKGLVTGGLPTFIDVAHNFDSPHITEDSVVQQLHSRGRNITVLGDDTWISLFPNSFSRSFVFPSFDVRDLDTVDTGVLTHLEAELQRTDTSLLIAHFLGVDHAGHRYGPDHPRMAEKQRQMNEVVRGVCLGLAEDTLLLVIGDHGMTSTGDHGGDSENEVTSALFAYSPGLSTASSDDSPVVYPQVVQQVSLVPTLSLLLGVPIPFSNIGSVIPELFVNDRQLTALEVNVKQVHRYLALYDERFRNNKFPHDMWKDLQTKKNDIELLQTLDFQNNTYSEKVDEVLKRNLNKHIDSEHKKSVIDGDVLLKLQRRLHVHYLTLAKAMCEEVWATFDVSVMVSGVILMIVTVLNLFVIVLSLNKHEDTQSYFVKGNIIMIVVILTSALLKYCIDAPVVNFLPALFAGVVVVFHCSKINSLSLFAASKDFIPLLLFAVICLGSFSNSFVVNEDYVISFCLISLYIFLTFRVIFVHKNKTFEGGRVVNLERISILSTVVAVTTCIISCVAVRFGQTFYRCREEQKSCVTSNLFQPLSSIDTSLQNTRYFTGIVSLLILGYAPKSWLSHCGNLNGYRVSVIVGSYSGSFCALMVAAYWAMEAVPRPTDLTISYTSYIPRTVYAVAVLATITIFIKPLMIFQFKNKPQPVQASNAKQIIPELFQNMKAQYAKERSGECGSDTPVVYGLATGVSAPLVAVYSLLLVVITLLVGDGLAPATLTLSIAVMGWFLLNSITCWTNPALDSVMRLRWINPVFWFVLSIHTFYTLSHQTTFSTIPWSAAFIGGSSNGTLVSTLLVGTHVFAGHLWLGLALPLLSLAPLGAAVMFPELRRNRNVGELGRGEFILVDRPEVLVAATTTTALAYLGLHATKVLFSSVSALLLRRHLMVWKVFAPHLVFEGVGLLVSASAVAVGLLVTHRVIGALHNWATDITLVKIKPL